jgi:hypothetical protein
MLTKSKSMLWICSTCVNPMDTGRTPAAQPAEQRNVLMETWNMERKNTMQPATTRIPYTKDKVDGDLGYGDEDYIHMYNVTDNGASIP